MAVTDAYLEPPFGWIVVGVTVCVLAAKFFGWPEAVFAGVGGGLGVLLGSMSVYLSEGHPPQLGFTESHVVVLESSSVSASYAPSSVVAAGEIDRIEVHRIHRKTFFELIWKRRSSVLNVDLTDGSRLEAIVFNWKAVWERLPGKMRSLLVSEDS